jgi:signal transduction histidine kinase
MFCAMKSAVAIDGVVVLRRSGIVDAVDGAAPERWVGSLFEGVANLEPGERDRLVAALARIGGRRFSATCRVSARVHGRPVVLSVVIVDALPMRRALVPLREVLLRAMDAFVAQAASNEVELRVDIAADLPPVIEGDGEKLAWALATLVGNSLRLVTGGSSKRGAPSVEVRARLDEAQIVLAVTDNGPGMSPHVSRWLFERDPSTGRAAGLALLMVRDVVFAHGGTIEVESAPEAGATFTIRLPRHHGAELAP